MFNELEDYVFENYKNYKWSAEKYRMFLTDFFKDQTILKIKYNKYDIGSMMICVGYTQEQIDIFLKD